MKKYFYAVLLVLPLIYFSAGSYFHQNIGLYSVTTADPEYIYYINALAVANGEFKVGNIDHPGVPLDYLMAISMRVTHFFRTQNALFTEDVLANSDLYLRIINLQLILLTAGIMYLAGLLMLRIKPNIWYALIIQFFPFATDIIYGNLGRITTENIIPWPVIFLVLLVLHIYFNKEQFSIWKNLLLMAFIYAVGLSIKLTFAPLLIIPLILIGPWKKKVIFGMVVIAMFLIISIPVTLQLDYFTRWMKGLFLYSGFYGQGEKTIVKTSEFIPNIVNLYHANKSFFNLSFIFLLSSVTCFVFRKKLKLEKTIYWISFAVLSVIILQVLILGKNYKTTYFVPALILLPSIIILNIEFFKAWIKNVKFKSAVSLYAGLVIVFLFFNQLPIAKGLSVHFDRRMEHRMKASYFMRNLDENSIKIIVPGFYGAPLPEYALMTSYQWAGKFRSSCKPALAKLFPNTYIFYPWDQTLNYWGEDLDLNNSGKNIFVYFENPDNLEKFKTGMEKYLPDNPEFEEVFNNNETKEVILRLKRSLKSNQP